MADTNKTQEQLKQDALKANPAPSTSAEQANVSATIRITVDVDKDIVGLLSQKFLKPYEGLKGIDRGKVLIAEQEAFVSKAFESAAKAYITQMVNKQYMTPTKKEREAEVRRQLGIQIGRG